MTSNLSVILDDAWNAAKSVPGFLGENEARFLGMLVACIPAEGLIVEIGSFKGRSTVMLGKVASRLGLGPVVSIDPHNHNLSDKKEGQPLGPSTYDDFTRSITQARILHDVEVHRSFSETVSVDWNRPVRLLWIDGDHSYEGAKKDLGGFLPHVVPQGVVALHDALNNFPGPIKVFVDDMLSSDQFGPAGFVQSVAWAQYRPMEGSKFRRGRQNLGRRAARLIPFVQSGQELHGIRKVRYKLARSRIPRAPIALTDLTALLRKN